MLSSEELPKGFQYPDLFTRLVSLGILNIEPWWIPQGDLLRQRMASLRSRYPDRTLVIFASRQDNDDIACWDIDQGGVSLLHDFAEPGWEQRQRLTDFAAWLRLAIDDFIEFD